MREYTAVFKRSGSWIVAWIEEIPGVNTQGKTMVEARENLADALKLMLHESRAFGKGKSVKREPFLVPFSVR